MPHIINKLWTSAPSEIFAAIKRRLNRKQDWDYSLEILNSKKHINAQYLIDRWDRYWRVIESHNQDGSRKHFEFQNKAIFELGCGPLFGWGPIALYRGATNYYYHEPSLIRQVVESKAIKEKYFFPLYQELLSNFGNLMPFDQYYEKVMGKCAPVDFNGQESVDLILSNSVIEHLPRADIEDICSKLLPISKVGAYFLHSVDFGSHGIGGNGFGSLYTRSSKKELRYLNLLRMSEIEKHLIKSGFQLLHSTVYHTGEIDRNLLHDTWQDYSDRDLTSRVVFFVGVKLNK